MQTQFFITRTSATTVGEPNKKPRNATLNLGLFLLTVERQKSDIFKLNISVKQILVKRKFIDDGISIRIIADLFGELRKVLINDVTCGYFK